LIAALILGTSSGNCVSTISAPCSPNDTAMLPPKPNSTYRLSAICSGRISTAAKRSAPGFCAQGSVDSAAAAAANNQLVLVIVHFLPDDALSTPRDVLGCPAGPAAGPRPSPQVWRKAGRIRIELHAESVHRHRKHPISADREEDVEELAGVELLRERIPRGGGNDVVLVELVGRPQQQVLDGMPAALIRPGDDAVDVLLAQADSPAD